jgi:hypothetical protein
MDEIEESIYDGILAELKPGSLWGEEETKKYLEISEKKYLI